VEEGPGEAVPTATEATLETLYHLGPLVRGERRQAMNGKIAKEIRRLLHQRRSDGQTRYAYLAEMVVREAEAGDAVFVRIAMEAEHDYDPRTEAANWGEDDESED
jgi:hypothetical protein